MSDKDDNKDLEQELVLAGHRVISEVVKRLSPAGALSLLNMVTAEVIVAHVPVHKRPQVLGSVGMAVHTAVMNMAEMMDGVRQQAEGEDKA